MLTDSQSLFQLLVRPPGAPGRELLSTDQNRRIQLRSVQRNVKKDGTTGQWLLVSNIQAFTDARRQLLSHTSHYLLALALQQTAVQSGGESRQEECKVL